MHHDDDKSQDEKAAQLERPVDDGQEATAGRSLFRRFLPSHYEVQAGFARWTFAFTNSAKTRARSSLSRLLPQRRTRRPSQPRHLRPRSIAFAPFLTTSRWYAASAAGTMPESLLAGRSSSLTSTPKVPVSVLNLKSGRSPGISPGVSERPPFELRLALVFRLFSCWKPPWQGLIGFVR